MKACVKHNIPWVYGGVLGTYGLTSANRSPPDALPALSAGAMRLPVPCPL